MALTIKPTTLASAGSANALLERAFGRFDKALQAPANIANIFQKRFDTDQAKQGKRIRDNLAQANTQQEIDAIRQNLTGSTLEDKEQFLDPLRKRSETIEINDLIGKAAAADIAEGSDRNRKILFNQLDADTRFDKKTEIPQFKKQFDALVGEEILGSPREQAARRRSEQLQEVAAQAQLADIARRQGEASSSLETQGTLEALDRTISNLKENIDTKELDPSEIGGVIADLSKEMRDRGFDSSPTSKASSIEDSLAVITELARKGGLNRNLIRHAMAGAEVQGWIPGSDRGLDLDLLRRGLAIGRSRNILQKQQLEIQLRKLDAERIKLQKQGKAERDAALDKLLNQQISAQQSTVQRNKFGS